MYKEHLLTAPLCPLEVLLEEEILFYICLLFPQLASSTPHILSTFDTKALNLRKQCILANKKNVKTNRDPTRNRILQNCV